VKYLLRIVRGGDDGKPGLSATVLELAQWKEGQVPKRRNAKRKYNTQGSQGEKRRERI